MPGDVTGPIAKRCVDVDSSGSESSLLVGSDGLGSADDAVCLEEIISTGRTIAAGVDSCCFDGSSRSAGGVAWLTSLAGLLSVGTPLVAFRRCGTCFTVGCTERVGVEAIEGTTGGVWGCS